MHVKFEADFKAGGYPSPTYHGTKTFGLNAADDANLSDLIEEAQRTARTIVASDMCFEPRCVSITQVRIVEQQ